MKNFNMLVPAETERLFCLIEEAGEMLQIVGKIGRHGYYSCHPNGGPNNRELLERELGDLLYSIRAMAKKYDIDMNLVEEHAFEKANRIKPYLHHQKPGEEE
jgi:NTP pyrophosphatase (non-canonical NTP hydrolase)